MKSSWHKASYQKIESLSEIPKANSDEYFDWISGDKHLQFIRSNSKQGELIIFASANSIFVHSIVVPNQNLSPKIDMEDLLNWSINPYHHDKASYVWKLGTSKEVWIKEGVHCAGAETLENGHPLVYGRIFEGWNGNDNDYLEIHQEYTHLTNTHWRSEHNGYCRFDENGDIKNVISLSSDTGHYKAKFVSFLRQPLEEYLIVSDSTLIQLFVFTMFQPNGFSGWSGQHEVVIKDKEEFAYKKLINEFAGYYRGVQIISPNRSRTQIISAICSENGIDSNKKYESFLTHDWRNDRIVEVSTDPKATTGYFHAENNSLPFELSPAFFRPDVLAKYKADSDKYTVEDRQIICRATWSLYYDVNEESQVHAYLCDLRNLPNSEQIYWKSFNESPSAWISTRAMENDFLNQPTDNVPPVQKILMLLRNWKSKKYLHWSLRNEILLKKVSTPYTTSRDEWGREFLNLSKLVIEGFEVERVRALLDEYSMSYDHNDRSLVLIEKLIQCCSSQGEDFRLSGLREAQLIRTKLEAHASQKTANSLANRALKEHGSYTAHFNNVCEKIICELQIIEKTMNST